MPVYDFISEVTESPGALRKWLLEYKLHHEFNPNDRAPFSHGKQAMIDEAKSEEQIIIEDLIADKKHPLVSHDLIVVHILRELMGKEMGDLTGLIGSPVGVRRLMESMGYTPLKRVRIGPERFFCWSKSREVVEMHPTDLRNLISGRLDALQPL